MKKQFKKSLLSVAIVSVISYGAIAQNIGFEDGSTTGWSGSSISAVQSQIIQSGSNTWTVNPYGTYMGKLTITSGTFSQMASALNLTQSSVSGIQSTLTTQAVTTGNGGGQPTTASWISKTVTLTAGQQFTLAWQYISTDYVPFNDGSIATLVKVGDPTVTGIINNYNSQYALLGFTNPGTGDYSTGSYGATGWQTATYTVTTSGEYLLGFSSFNLDDTALSPVLYIDEISSTTLLNGIPFLPIAPNPGTNAPDSSGGSISPPSSPTLISNVTGSTGTDTLGSGNITVNGGTVQVAMTGATLTQLFNVESGGMTIDQNNNSAIVSGIVSGTGNVVIANSGTSGSITFTAINTYTGLTTINSGATLINDGSIISSSGITNNGIFINNGEASGVDNTGIFTNSTTGTISSLTNSGTSTNNGTIIGSVTNSGIFTNTGSVGNVDNISGTYTNDGVTGNVNNSGTVNNNGTVGAVNNSGWFTNTINAIAGFITNSGTFTNNGTTGSVSNSGTFTNNNTTGNVSNDGWFTNTVNAIAGFITNTGLFTNAGTTGNVDNSGVIYNTGTMGNGTNTGTYTNFGISGDINNFGTFTTSGTAGMINNSGTVIMTSGSLSGINNAGAFTVSNATLGQYTQSSSGTTVMFMNAPFTVSGAASLDGGLVVTNSPTAYGRYTAFTAASIEGGYKSLSSNGVNDYLKYSNGEVKLYVTPDSIATQSSINVVAGNMSSMNNLQSGVINNALGNDCNVFGDNGACISINISNTAASSGDLVSGGVTFAKRFNANWRAGLFLTNSFNNPTIGGVSQSNNPAYGGFVSWNKNADGTGLGLQGAIVTNTGNMTVTRFGPETGVGNSATNGTAFQLKGTYSQILTENIIFTNYIGIRRTTLNIGGYTETGPVFPLTFNGTQQTTTDLIAGVGASYKITDKLTTNANIGIVQNLINTGGSFNGISEIGNLQTFNSELSATKYTSAALGFGISYDIGKNQRIGVSMGWQQKSLVNANITSYGLTYTVGF